MSMMSVTTKVEDESDQMNYTDQLENNIKNLQKMALDVSKLGRKDKINPVTNNQNVFNVDKIQKA